MSTLLLNTQRMLLWFPRPELGVLVVRGSPTAEDVEILLRTIEFECTLPPHAVILDIRRVDVRLDDPVVLSATFQWTRFLATNGKAFFRVITRGAFVHDGGVIASLIAGYNRLIEDQKGKAGKRSDVDNETVISRKPPRKYCESIEEAVAWLGYDETVTVDIGKMLESAAESSGAVDVTRVLDWLSRNLTTASLKACAQAFGVSERALQRTLTEGNTHWRDVLVQARLERAKQRLTTTDDKLATIAFDVGLVKPQSLVAMFQRELGVTPDQWRKAQRSSG